VTTRAISRSWLWRLMILAVAVRLVVGPPFQAFSHFPWISVAFVCAGIVVLNPVMDKNLPISVGSDIIKSLRTYIGTGLFIAAYYYHPGR
jgi:hypothetical protein